MSRNATGTVRTGVHVAAAGASGCHSCGHPFTLHSNGRTGCRAAGCTAGPAAACGECHGTTVSLVTNEECGTCQGRGTVTAPCPGFAREHPVPELLAS
jgi:hypothetical protein